MASTALLLALLPALTSAWVKEMENKDLYQGDMMLSPDQMEEVYKGEYTFGSIKDKMWPTNIAYDFHESLASEPQANRAVQAAIKEYEKYTCLRFKRRTTETTYMLFFSGGGCWSYVGMSYGVNQISLSRGCWSRSTAIHEIGHSLGFHHEQSRPDRDNYLNILWNNIHSGMRYNFDKGHNIDSRGTPYDYFSVMHYSKTAFGINGAVTMQTKKDYYQDLIGTVLGMSPMDIKQVNLVYKCKPYTGELPLEPTPECHDYTSYCEMFIWQNPDYCKDPHRREKRCPVACGACIPGKKREPPCYDASKDCQRNVKMCNDPASGWDKWMKDNCFKTCGYCGKKTPAPGETTAVPGQQTTVAATTRAPVTTKKPIPSCKNKRSECDSWKKYCDEPRAGWRDYLKRNCPVTCGFC